MFLIIWFCLGIVGAMIANNKGNSSFGGFALGVILGPIGLLIALFSSDNEEAKRSRTGHIKKCPYCAEYVKSEAIVCKHCGRSLDIGSNINGDKSKFSNENSDNKFYADKEQTQKAIKYEQVEKDFNTSEEIPLNDQTNSLKHKKFKDFIFYIILISILTLFFIIIFNQNSKSLNDQYPYGWFVDRNQIIDECLLEHHITNIQEYYYRTDREDVTYKYLVACKDNNDIYKYYAIDTKKDEFNNVSPDNSLIRPQSKSNENNQTQRRNDKEDYSNKISSYALDPYTKEGYPETIREFGSRLKEIERYRKKAAELAIDEYGCGYVEIVELSTSSTISHLIFFVDCDNYKKRVLLSEDEIDKLYSKQ